MKKLIGTLLIGLVASTQAATWNTTTAEANVLWDAYSTNATGVALSGTLDVSGDPATGEGVGNRDYNDNRYVTDVGDYFETFSLKENTNIIQWIEQSPYSTYPIVKRGNILTNSAVNTMVFDGSDDYCVLPTMPTIGTSNFTFNCYFKGNISSGNGIIFTAGKPLNGYKNLTARLRDTGYVDILTSNDLTNTVTHASAGTNYNDNAWHKFTVLKDDTYLWLYIDSQRETYYDSSAIDSVAPTVAGTIGAEYYTSSYVTEFTGNISGVSLEVPSNTRDLYIYAGQSNCEGNQPNGSTNLPARLQSSAAAYYYASIDGGTTVYSNYLSRISASRWGSELTMGEQIIARSEQMPLILKVSKGGSLLATDWQQGGDQYIEFTNAYTQAVNYYTTKGYTVGDIRFAWMQGEADRSNTTYSANYEANFDAMIASMESDLSIDIKQIVMCRVKDKTAWGVNNTNVRAAQVAIGNRHGNAWVDTDSYDTSDGTHYTDEYYLTMGNEIGKKFGITKRFNEGVYYPLAEGSGTNIYNVVGNTNHATSVGSTWTTAANPLFYNNLYGFRTAVADTNPRIPALLSGVSDAGGGVLTAAGGSVHNGAEGSLTMDDANTYTYAQLKSASVNALSDLKTSYNPIMGRIATAILFSEDAVDHNVDTYLHIKD